MKKEKEEIIESQIFDQLTTKVNTCAKSFDKSQEKEYSLKLIAHYYSNKGNKKIISDGFFKRRNKSCFIIINNKLITNNHLESKKDEDIIQVKIFMIDSISNLDSMFGGCTSLKAVEKFKCINVESTKSMFENCFSLEYISNNFIFLYNNEYKSYDFYNFYHYDNNKIIYNNLIDEEEYFYPNSKKITNEDAPIIGDLSDISIKEEENSSTNNTINDIIKYFSNYFLKDISFMFSGCSSLKKLPDSISEWNTEYITNMEAFCKGCLSLEFLPKINLWNTSHAKNMSYMFSDCSSLISLPDISSWNVNCVKNMGFMFYSCSSLLYIPDVFEWSFHSVTDMSYIFANCISLRSLPDISKLLEKLNDNFSIYSKETFVKSVQSSSSENKTIKEIIKGFIDNCCSLEIKSPFDDNNSGNSKEEPSEKKSYFSISEDKKNFSKNSNENSDENNDSYTLNIDHDYYQKIIMEGVYHVK